MIQLVTSFVSPHAVSYFYSATSRVRKTPVLKSVNVGFKLHVIISEEEDRNMDITKAYDAKTFLYQVAYVWESALQALSAPHLNSWNPNTYVSVSRMCNLQGKTFH